VKAGEIAKRVLDTYPPSEFEELARAYLEVREALGDVLDVATHVIRMVDCLDAARAEAEFLAASVAVWREIDKLTDENDGIYPGLPQSAELRQRERAAWERYRSFLNAYSERK
jgi:hypothetical protein